MEEHIRDLQKFLQNHGATDLHMEPGGKHNKLCFLFRGTEHQYVVNRRNPGDHRAVLNMISDLRRKLGPAIKQKSKSHRSLEDMMPEPLPIAESTDIPRQTEDPETKGIIWIARIACYKNSGQFNQVQIMFPAEILDSVFDFNSFDITRLDEEHWKLTSNVGGSHKFKRLTKKRVIVRYADFLNLFGSSAAEAVETDGELLIYLPIDKRVETRDLPSVKNAADIPPAKPPKATANGTAWIKPLTELMHEIVQQIREIEDSCPYRLIRLQSGRIVWRAPTIE